MMKKHQTFQWIFYVLFIMVLCSSCVIWDKERKWKPVKPAKHAFVHTVTWNDETMDVISKWYTKDSANANELIKANPTVNPKRIVSGSLIYIPKKLLKTRKKMPRSFLTNSKKKKSRRSNVKVRKKAPVKEPKPEDDFELFGPR